MMLVVLQQSLQYLLFFPLSRDCVRERNEGRGSPSSSVSDIAVGLRSPCKQVLLVPHTGEDYYYYYCFNLHSQALLD